jgi:hypothetical protein
MTKRQQNQIDKQIEQIYYRRCSGIQINIMDIGKVFAAGRAALAAGADVESAIVARVEQLRLN